MKSHFAFALAFTAFFPVTALAQSQEEQQACMNDAFTVCGHAIPDRDRVATCLAQNISRVSPGCRMVMARYSRPGAAPSRRDRVIEPDDRYDRGDQFNRNNDWFGRNDRRDPYWRY